MPDVTRSTLYFLAKRLNIMNQGSVHRPPRVYLRCPPCTLPSPGIRNWFPLPSSPTFPDKKGVSISGFVNQITTLLMGYFLRFRELASRRRGTGGGGGGLTPKTVSAVTNVAGSLGQAGSRLSNLSPLPKAIPPPPFPCPQEEPGVCLYPPVCVYTSFFPGLKRSLSAFSCPSPLVGGNLQWRPLSAG